MPHDDGPDIMKVYLGSGRWYGKSNSLSAKFKSNPISCKCSHKNSAALLYLDLTQ